MQPPTSTHFSGLIDDVRMYSRALAIGEIALLAVPGRTHEITINLSETDYYALKQTPGLATDISDSFLSITSGLITDLALVPNHAREIANDAGLRASTFYEDITPPTFDIIPGAMTVECGDSLDSSATGQATATDNADPSPVITYEDDLGDPCPITVLGTIMVVRTWTATDACGNSKTAQQMITVEDTTAPTVLNVSTNESTTLDGTYTGPADLDILVHFF